MDVAQYDNELEPDETVEVMFIDYRESGGEWGKCRKCGTPVFAGGSHNMNAKVSCRRCGELAFELASVAVRRRRIDLS